MACQSVNASDHSAAAMTSSLFHAAQRPLPVLWPAPPRTALREATTNAHTANAAKAPATTTAGTKRPRPTTAPTTVPALSSDGQPHTRTNPKRAKKTATEPEPVQPSSAEPSVDQQAATTPPAGGDRGKSRKPKPTTTGPPTANWLALRQVRRSCLRHSWQRDLPETNPGCLFGRTVRAARPRTTPSSNCRRSQALLQAPQGQGQREPGRR